MACTPVSSSLRRRRFPLAAGNGYFAPVDLTGLQLIRALASLASDVSSADPSLRFQRRNSRCLARRARTFLCLFESLRDSPSPSSAESRLLLLPPSATLCLKELYILLYRSKILLDYCWQSSRLWLLLHNSKISIHFHDLTLELSTLLDVLPLQSLGLSPDVREQIELLRLQVRRSKLYVDPRDESLRLRIYSFLDQFEQGYLPDLKELQDAFIEKLGIRDPRACRAEIEFLEEQIYNQDEEVDTSVLDGAVALMRYCRFRLFGFGPEPYDRKLTVVNGRIPSMKGKTCQSQGIEESFVTIPKEFCCPISLDLMRDPVIVSTGQTYDRSSITRWTEEGHNTCPNSGQTLMHKRLIPNRALRSLISQWCTNMGVSYDPPEALDASGDNTMVVVPSKAALEVNKATADLLVKRLEDGMEEERTVAARELRLLARTAKENRAYIAEAGAIPLLARLLLSKNEVAQENSVTAILNLSIHDKNKSRVMEVDGCLTSIVAVLSNGLTTEARENAAATLFSLSAVHEYKKMISNEEGALEALAGLLRDGTPRGKRDAVTALFNLSTHSDCSERMVASGAASALVDALATEGVIEEAAGALGLLVRRPAAATAVAKDGKAVAALVGLMRQGSPKGKENAAAALAEMCRNGGAVATEIVASMPSISGLIQTLLFTGTKRARRKAASLARSFQRYEASGGMLGLFQMEFNMPRSRSLRRSQNSSSAGGSEVSERSSNFSNGDVTDVSVSMPVSISVPVL